MSTKTTRRPFLRRVEHMLQEARRTMGLEHFPFETTLSMVPLLDYWRQNKDHDHPHVHYIASEVSAYIEQNPSVLEPYQDAGTFLKDHRAVLDLLFSGIFPTVTSRNFLGYASPPFSLTPFYTTEATRALLSDPKVTIQFEQFGEFDKIPYSVRACFIILQKYYQIDLDHNLPLLLSLQFEGSTMEQFYKTTSMTDFIVVRAKKPAPDISQEKLDFLLKHMDDEALWLDSFSPDVFYFEGFFVAIMNDVTEVETLSRLRKILLAPSSLLDAEQAKAVANLTRIYLNLPDVEVGISAIDFPSDHSVAHRYKIDYPVIETSERPLSEANRNSLYRKACRLNRMQIISDLTQIADPAPIDQALVSHGFRSLMVVPLRDQKKQIIGMMELASPTPYVFTQVKRLKLKEILPLYDVALEEIRVSIDNRIQSVIQNKFTNIHPSILWKFTDTAFRYLEQKDDPQQRAVLRPIVFEDVYPLFGQIDINSSTAIRDKAVQTDMLKNLQLLRELLQNLDHSQFHLLKKYAHEVNKYLEQLATSFDPGLEATVDAQLLKDIHPLLRQLSQRDEWATSQVERYFEEMDDDHGLVYEYRDRYTESLGRINQLISSYLDEEEISNQQLVPHYFDKYTTDGVEYNMYVGQALLQHDHFTIHHLHNLRLWQLESMVQLHALLESQRPTLPIDMTVSYLIIVYNGTVSIRFRTDEKQFDIDGAHNIRYEILKKRVDKATIVGTGERLTHRDKIAIVFVQEKDRLEYHEYLHYLIDEGKLADDIEEVEIEQVQGIQGALRALRVSFLAE